MLVLRRRKDESVMLGDTIRVCLVEIRGGTVQLGFEAPRELPVYRLEIWQRLREQEAALAERVRSRDGRELAAVAWEALMGGKEHG